MPRRGLAGAITGTPCARRSGITPLQLEASAKAPWTRTTVGRAVVSSVAAIFTFIGFSAAVRSSVGKVCAETRSALASPAAIPSAPAARMARRLSGTVRVLAQILTVLSIVGFLFCDVSCSDRAPKSCESRGSRWLHGTGADSGHDDLRDLLG